MRPGSSIAGGMLQLLVPCAVVLAGATALVWVWRDALAEQAAQQRAVERQLLEAIEAWAPSPSGPNVVVLGDSLGICRDARRGRKRRVAAELAETLEQSGMRADVLDLVHPGLQPVDFLALLGEASGQRPRLAVVAVNLRVFRPSHETDEARLTQLVRKLTLRQAWAVRDDLSEAGISMLDVVLMRGKERLGLLYSVEGLREWALRWLDAASSGLSRLLGIAPPSRRYVAVDGEGRGSAYRSRFAAHPTAETLRVLRREMEAAGVPVLFYVAPVSPARLAENGVDAAEFAARVDELRRAVGASDEGWLDLHAAAAPSLFRDRRNHLRAAGCGVVVAALTERVRALIQPSDHRLASAERVLEPPPGRFAGARPGSAR